MKTKAPNSVNVTIMTTITIVFWVFFSVYRILTSEPESPVTPEILEAIDPSLDIETLNQIEKSIYFSDAELVEILKNVSPTQTPIVEITEVPVVTGPNETESSTTPSPTETPISP